MIIECTNDTGIFCDVFACQGWLIRCWICHLRIVHLRVQEWYFCFRYLKVILALRSSKATSLSVFEVVTASTFFIAECFAFQVPLARCRSFKLSQLFNSDQSLHAPWALGRYSPFSLSKPSPLHGLPSQEEFLLCVAYIACVHCSFQAFGFH